MAVENLEEFIIDNFSKGLDLSEDPRSLNEYASPDTQNVRFLGTTFYSRPGYEAYLDTLTGSGFLGLHPWIKNDSLVSAHGGKIYRGDEITNAWIEIPGSFNSTAEVGFQEYLGDIYLGNAVDAFTRIQHTSYTKTEPAGAPLGNIFNAWAEKMWVAGQTANPRTLYYSRTASAANPEYIYDFSGTGSGSELLGKEGNITGLSATKNALIVFKNNECYYIRTFDSTTLAPSIELLSGKNGCAGRKAYCKVKDEIYFFTGTEVRLVAEYQGYPNLYTSPISNSIRRYLTSELDADQSGAVMAFDENANLLKLWVKLEGATNYNICLVYHFDEANKTWTIDTGKTASQAVSFGNVVYWSSSVVGRVWKDEIGSSDDVGTIEAYRWSKLRKLYSEKGRKKFRYLTLAGSMDVDTTIDIKLYIDGSLVKEETITSSDVIGDASSGIGPVGTYPVGTAPVGGVNNQIRQFEKRIKLNKIGRYVQLYIGSSTLGGWYQVTDEAYSYIPMPRATEKNY